MVRNRRCYFFPFVWPVRVSAIRFYAWIFSLLESARVGPGSLHVSPRGVCECRFVRSLVSCYEIRRIAIGETAFRRHRDAVSLRLRRRFLIVRRTFCYKSPSNEVLRLKSNIAKMCANNRRKHRKNVLYTYFEAWERSNLQISVPLEGLGIAGATRSNML